MGNGEFVEAMLRHNILPSDVEPQSSLDTYDNSPPSRCLASTSGHEALPSALAFHRRMIILAAELGLLARDIRAEEKQNPDNRSHAVMQSRHKRIGVWQDTLRRAWDVQVPASMANGYSNQILPVGARGIYEHVSVIASTPFLFLSYDNLQYSVSCHRSLEVVTGFESIKKDCIQRPCRKASLGVLTNTFHSHPRFTVPA